MLAPLFRGLDIPRDNPVRGSEPGKALPAEHQLIEDAGTDDGRLRVPQLMQLGPKLRALRLVGLLVESCEEAVLIRDVPPSRPRPAVDILQR